LGDIESNLRALGGVHDAVVVPLYRDEHIDALAAFVIADCTGDETEFQAALHLRRALAERVPAYMVPRVVRTVARFPMTTNGKVDRRALAAELA
jgi:D-alanine--poly(phosphoribitol) ligase subunit 1